MVFFFPQLNCFCNLSRALTFYYSMRAHRLASGEHGAVREWELSSLRSQNTSRLERLSDRVNGSSGLNIGRKKWQKGGGTELVEANQQTREHSFKSRSSYVLNVLSSSHFIENPLVRHVFLLLSSSFPPFFSSFEGHKLTDKWNRFERTRKSVQIGAT